MESRFFYDIKGNSFELCGDCLAWRDEKGDCGFLVKLDYLDEVNIGGGEEGASAIQLFLRAEQDEQRYEYYFEFEGEADAATFAHAILEAKAALGDAAPER